MDFTIFAHIYLNNNKHQQQHKNKQQMTQKLKLALILIIWGIATLLVIPGCKKENFNNSGIVQPPIVNVLDTSALISNPHWEIEAFFENDTNKINEYRQIIESEDFYFNSIKQFILIKNLTAFAGGQTTIESGTWSYSNKKLFLYTVNQDSIFGPPIIIDSMLIEKLELGRIHLKEFSTSSTIIKYNLIAKK